MAEGRRPVGWPAVWEYTQINREDEMESLVSAPGQLGFMEAAAHGLDRISANRWRWTGDVLAVVLLTAVTCATTANAQTYSESLVCSCGPWPNAAITLDPEGNLYATTVAGGDYGIGAVIKVDTARQRRRCTASRKQAFGKRPSARIRARNYSATPRATCTVQPSAAAHRTRERYSSSSPGLDPKPCLTRRATATAAYPSARPAPRR